MSNRCLSRSALTLPTRRPEPIELHEGSRSPFLPCTASGNGAGDTPGSLKANALAWYSRHVRATAFLDAWALADSLSRSFAFSTPVTSIIPTVRAASLLCDPITTPQQRNISPASATVLDQVRRFAASCPNPEMPRARRFQTFTACSLGFSPMGQSLETKSNILHAQLGQAENHRAHREKPAQKCARSIRHVLSLQPEYSCAQRSNWNYLRVIKTKRQHIASIQTKPPQTASRHENCTHTEDASGVEWSRSERSNGDNLIFSLMLSRLNYRRSLPSDSRTCKTHVYTVCKWSETVTRTRTQRLGGRGAE